MLGDGSVTTRDKQPAWAPGFNKGSRGGAQQKPQTSLTSEAFSETPVIPAEDWHRTWAAIDSRVDLDLGGW